MENVVIIGSGPAGSTAALYTSRANLAPVVVEGMEPGGQLTTTTEVENYPGFAEAVTGPELVNNMRRQAEHFGARYLAGEVTAVSFGQDNHSLTFGNGETVQTRALIIAAGAKARYLGLPSEQKLIGRGVSGCATCDGAFFRNQEVAVVGGGDTAMEDALFLARLAAKVTIIHRRDALRASRIMAERVLSHDKISVRWNSVVAEVMDVDKGEVTGVRLQDTSTGEFSRLPLSGLFIAIGHQPNSSVFKGLLAMDETGYLLTDNTRTEVPGVFAAGDIQDRVYRQAVTAAGTGCMAALEAERYLSRSRP